MIMIVGEAYGEEELHAGKPFVGPSGRFLKTLLDRAGINRKDCYLTNVFNLRPPNSNDVSNLCGPKEDAIPGLPRLSNGKYVSRKYEPELLRLRKEVLDVKPTLIIALGGTAAWALLGTSGIKKIRGAPLYGYNGVKILPTYHPAAVLREYALWPVLLADLEKAKRESTFPEVRRPKREFWLEPSLEDLADFEPYIYEAAKVSVDIETWNKQITCVGFAPSASRAIVIPFCSRTAPDGNYWPSLREELAAWSYVRKWCREVRTLGQNFLYDANYLWRIYGISLPRMCDDSMLAHHALQPELEKGLGFLGSIYTNEPAWKFMRAGAETLKKED